MKTYLMIAFFALASKVAFSGVPQLECRTNHHSSQQFKFSDSKVNVNVNTSTDANRNIASSVNFSNVRTRWSGNSMEKIGFFENKKHIIHIDDVSRPSEVNDYISIRSQEGHEVLYPLHCQLLK